MKQLYLLTFFVMASLAAKAQNVGIGTTTPAAMLDVNGTIAIRGNNPGTGKLLVSNSTGAASWGHEHGYNTGFSVSLFTAYAAAANVTAAQTIPFGMTTTNDDFDDGNNFINASNGFKAPEAGLYHLEATIYFLLPNYPTTNTVIAYFETPVTSPNHFGQSTYRAAGLSTQQMIKISCYKRLAANEVVTVKIRNFTGDDISIFTFGSSNFTGVQLY